MMIKRLQQIRIAGLFAIIFCSLIVGLFSSCRSKHIFEQYQKLPDSVWDYYNHKSFTFEIKDTSLLYNIYLNLRISGRYSYSNIWIVSELEYPDKHLEKQKKDYVMATPEGQWLGKSLGDIIDNQFILFEKRKLNKRGKYIVRLKHDMRVEKLPEILDVGITVVKAN